MAAVTVTLTNICAGGNHLTFSTTGAKEMTVVGDRVDFIEGPITDEDARTFIRVLCKIARANRTMVQTRNLFQAGVTVTV